MLTSVVSNWPFRVSASLAQDSLAGMTPRQSSPEGTHFACPSILGRARHTEFPRVRPTSFPHALWTHRGAPAALLQSAEERKGGSRDSTKQMCLPATERGIGSLSRSFGAGTDGDDDEALLGELTAWAARASHGLTEFRTKNSCDCITKTTAKVN